MDRTEVYNLLVQAASAYIFQNYPDLLQTLCLGTVEVTFSLILQLDNWFRIVTAAVETPARAQISESTTNHKNSIPIPIPQPQCPWPSPFESSLGFTQDVVPPVIAHTDPPPAESDPLEASRLAATIMDEGSIPLVDGPNIPVPGHVYSAYVVVPCLLAASLVVGLAIWLLLRDRGGTTSLPKKSNAKVPTTRSPEYATAPYTWTALVVDTVLWGSLTVGPPLAFYLLARFAPPYAPCLIALILSFLPADAPDPETEQFFARAGITDPVLVLRASAQLEEDMRTHARQFPTSSAFALLTADLPITPVIGRATNDRTPTWHSFARYAFFGLAIPLGFYVLTAFGAPVPVAIAILLSCFTKKAQDFRDVEFWAGPAERFWASADALFPRATAPEDVIDAPFAQGFIDVPFSQGFGGDIAQGFGGEQKPVERKRWARRWVSWAW
ncbi:hypothetical protein B0H16DRAFT_1690291 [Mycena metata]|uniref:Uncharacterized protein n=1 Tax=Mycena metata TaxID=1033252 RepID=A0AAD7J5T1_9AGAR|nr:hypothetical protein B0H16DRAFT_1690291 [Mycena metata]